jgi:integrase/recombinase XerD
MSNIKISSYIQRFFTNYLLDQLNASSHTVASYRDTFRLLLRFSIKKIGRSPSDLLLEEIDVDFLTNFLKSLEQERHNTVRSRNNRLAAIRTFFRYVCLNEPAFSLQCQRILAIPNKRYERKIVEFLLEDEATALVAAPNTDIWIGRRDRTLLLFALQTGLRNSEITSLKQKDVEFGTGAHVRCSGKGRKARCTPLNSEIILALKKWFAEQGSYPDAPIFPSLRGGSLSADALQRLVIRHATTASQKCPKLKGKAITPHTLRHTLAMSLLKNGVDITVIALWLGHESTESTLIYIHADMELKRQALKHATSSGVAPECYQAPDSLMKFLEEL